jgi:hypothetical protein
MTCSLSGSFVVERECSLLSLPKSASISTLIITIRNATYTTRSHMITHLYTAGLQHSWLVVGLTSDQRLAK